MKINVEETEIRYIQEIVYKKSTEDDNYLMCNVLATEAEKELEKDDIYMYARKVNEGDDSYVDSYAEPIPIEVMKKHIEDSEAKGANFIVVDWHSDHSEYDIYGLKIRRESEDENAIARKKRKDHTKAVKLVEIKRLQGVIENLKKEVDGN
jgi:hypothetical protein